jgi:hypothetical protein
LSFGVDEAVGVMMEDPKPYLVVRQSPGPAARAVEGVLSDPAASHWLKSALGELLSRDPVDAARDAGVLAELLANLADEKLVEAAASLNGAGAGAGAGG